MVAVTETGVAAGVAAVAVAGLERGDAAGQQGKTGAAAGWVEAGVTYLPPPLPPSLCVWEGGGGDRMGEALIS